MTKPTDTTFLGKPLVRVALSGLVLLIAGISLLNRQTTETIDAAEPIAAENQSVETSVTSKDSTRLETATADQSNPHQSNPDQSNPDRTNPEPSDAEGRTIMVLGDSISAAYGLDESSGWVQLLAAELKTSYPTSQVVNTSVSGETTTGGLQRLPAALDRFSPDIVIIELGGNDGLRGQSLKLMRDNLSAMIDLIHAADATPMLLGMRIPPNYGKTYADQFYQSYLDVAAEKKVQVVPFFLETIVGGGQYFQPDGIHPTKDAQPLMLEHVMPTIDTLMKSFE